MSSPNTTDVAIQKFADAVQRFCVWAESLPGDPFQEMKIAQQLLSELQFRVVALPDLEPSEEDYVDVITSEQRKDVYGRFMVLPVQGYWDTYDPLGEEGKEPVFNLLPDDLADIYKDIKEGLKLFEEGKINDAVWEWRFHFEGHWGRHLTSAQRAIYSYFS
jgi:hypothetical protein